MTLLPIKDDLLERTLATIPGILGKLNYVADLREGGRYAHWGLARTYGEEALQHTMGEIHRALFLQVLRTPLRQLLEDVRCSATAQRSDVRPYLEAILRNARSLVPPNLGGGSAAHFNSVVVALLSLLQ